MSEEANMNQEIFSNLEIDTIGEIMNISMGSAATAASTLLDNKVTITTPIVNVVPLDEFNIRSLEPAMAVEIKYVEGISGSNILILKRTDVRTILAQMMQTEIPDDYEIDAIGESAMCELMNQMMGSSATVLSCFLGRTINISTPIILPVNAIEDFKAEHFPKEENILTIKFSMNIEEIMEESEFVSVMDIALAKEIISVSLNFDESAGSEEEEAAPLPPPAVDQPQPAALFETPAASADMQQPIPQPPMQQAPPPMQPMYAQQPMYGGQPMYPQQPMYQQPMHPQQQPVHAPENPIVVKDFDYNDFGAGGPVQDMPTNIDLVMNVPVMVTVELGRTKRKIKEILEFGQGTIVELDKQAGSSVDVIVNGQLIAHGDVVVVDDNFSIRITEILKSRDSLTMP